MKVGINRKMRPSRCVNCGEIEDGATAVGNDAEPKPGDFTVCIYCGHLQAFDDDLQMRELTGQEFIKAAGDERIVAIMRALDTIKKREQQK